MEQKTHLLDRPIIYKVRIVSGKTDRFNEIVEKELIFGSYYENSSQFAPQHEDDKDANDNLIDELKDTQNQIKEMVQSSQSINTILVDDFIYKDDTVDTIKKKIVKALDINKTCFEELYLYGKFRSNLSLRDVYEEITKQNTEPLTKEKLEQLAINWEFGESESQILLYDKPEYSYNDLLKHFDKKQNRLLKKPFGFQFAKKYEHLHCASPFDIVVENKLYTKSSTNPLLLLDNSLLLNYGEPEENVIYCCVAENVYNDFIHNPAFSSELFEEFTRQYYPHLSNIGVYNSQTLDDNRQQRIDDFKNNHLDKFNTKNTSIRGIHEVYYKHKDKLDYDYFGVNKIDITLDKFFSNLPLEVIFKNIHCDEELLMIKYNPGFQQDSLYRLFYEKQTTKGTKIPVIERFKSSNFSKQYGKSKEIALYIKTADINEPIFVEMKNNGDLRIITELEQPLRIEAIDNDIFKPTVNSLLEKLNKYLSKTGIYFHSYQGLHVENVHYNNIEYSSRLNVDTNIANKNTFICGSYVFDTHIDMFKKKTNRIRYKRVDNYRHMESLHAFIHEVYQKEQNVKDVVDSLMRNKQMSQEEAELAYIEFSSNYVKVGDKYIENSGFPGEIIKYKLENKLSVNISNIHEREFLDFIHIFTSAFFLYHFKLNETEKQALNSLCTFEDIETDVTKNVIVNVVEKEELKPLGYNPNAIPIQEGSDDDDDDDDEDAYFIDDDDEESIDGDDEDEESDTNDTIEGGMSRQKKTLSTKPEKMEKPSTFFLNRLKERDGNLFLVKDDKPYRAFSRICPANVNRQPVILTETEKQNIDKNYKEEVDKNIGTDKIIKPPYKYALKYGSTKEKQHWFICPRYWNFNKNIAEPYKTDANDFDDEDDKNDKKKRDIHAFGVKSDGTTKEDNRLDGIEGKYNMFMPGFLDTKVHPSHCVPCCFRAQMGVKSKDQGKRREHCDAKFGDLTGLDTDTGDMFEVKIDNNGNEIRIFTQEDGTKIDRDTNDEYDQQGNNITNIAEPNNQTKDKVIDEKSSNYVLAMETLLLSNNRFGFLQKPVQKLFEIDYAKAIDKTNRSLIKPNLKDSVWLRKGVEGSSMRSFVSCLASLYSIIHNKDTLSVDKFIDILIDSLKIDDYVKYQNGSLVSIFRPKNMVFERISSSIISEHKQSKLFVKMKNDNAIPSEYKDDYERFVKESLASFNNFKEYLKNEDSWIDHVYLWDIICAKNNALFKAGLNLVILDFGYSDDGIVEKVDMLCPSNSYSSQLFDETKPTFFVIKYDNNYQPIYRTSFFKDKTFNIKPTADIEEIKEIPSLYNALIEINLKCSTKIVDQPDYKYAANISSIRMMSVLNKLVVNYPNKYAINKQVVNYRNKCIGFLIQYYDNEVYLPCFPSPTVEDKDEIILDLVSWSNYFDTMTCFLDILHDTENNILCKPIFNVIVEDNVVGIITETNQFIKVDPVVRIDSVNEWLMFDDSDMRNYRNIMREYNINIKTLMVDNKYQDDYEFDTYKEVERILATNTTDIDVERQTSIENLQIEDISYKCFRNWTRKALNQRENIEDKMNLINIIDKYRIMMTGNSNNDNLVGLFTEIVFILQGLLVNKHVVFVEDEESLIFIRKNTNICSVDDKERLYLSKLNDLTNEDNSVKYFIRLTDELCRNNRVRVVVLNDDNYSNIIGMDTAVNKNEIILSQQEIEDYFKTIDKSGIVKEANHITYDIAEPSTINFVPDDKIIIK